MKKWKGVLSLLLVVVMTLGLAGCGGSKNNVNANEEAKKYVYRMKDIEAEGISYEMNVRDAYYRDGRIYMLATQNYWDEMMGWVLSLLSVSEEGGDLQTVEIMNTLQKNPDWQPDEFEEPVDDPEAGIDPLSSVAPWDGDESADDTDSEAGDEPTDDTDSEAGGEAADDVDSEAEPQDLDTETEEIREYSNTYISTIKMTENYIYLVVENNTYSYDANYNYIPGEDTLVLYIYDFQGEQVGELLLNGDPDTYMWVRSISADADGNVAITFEEEVWVCSAQGKLLTKIPVDTSQVYVQTTFVDREGLLNLVCYNNEWTKLTAKKYNMQTGASAGDVELLDRLTNFNIQEGVNWDFFMTNSNGIYAYNIGDEDVTQLLSYINSDIDSSNIQSVAEMGDGKLFFMYYDDEWNTRTAIATYIPPEEVQDKEAIMLACSYLSWTMRRRVIAFNKENEQYRIVVNDYSAYNTPEDYTAGITRLNNDIISGQVPDILILTNEMPIDSYIAKGVFADIGKMIEEDEELNMEDYMTNVFDAYSVNGKLYSIVPTFSVYTLMGKTADVGDTPGWTMEDLQALIEARPEASAFGRDATRIQILNWIMRFAGSRFVDSESGKCHFDTQEFIDMLEFVASFPEQFDYESEGEDFWRDYDTQYRSGKTLLMSVYVNDFDNYIYWAHGQFGEPVTLIGFPAAEGIGAVIVAENRYAIAAKSKNKEGAWEFLRYYLTEEYQMGDEMYGMPVLRAAVLEKLEKAKGRPYWEYEDGTIEYYDRTYWLGDESIIMDPLSDEEADTLLAYMESVNMPDYYDESLLNIIEEETEAFFKGDKTAAEVAEIIQSRAQVYINESR